MTGRRTEHDRTVRARHFYNSMLILSLDLSTHKLKLDLNFVTSEISTKMSLNKDLLINREKSSSIATKLEFGFVAK